MPQRDGVFQEIVAGLFVPDTESRANQLEIALTDGRGWASVFEDEYGTSAGIGVTAKKALQVPSVWQAINLIAGDAGSLPLSPYQRTSDGVLQPAANHWTYSLTRWKANEDETAQEYWETIVAHALLWGNGYGLIARDGSNRASELLHLLPDRTRLEMADDGSRFVATEVGGKLVALPTEDVIHVRGIAYEDGMAPQFIHQARETVASALAAQNFQSRFFRNGGRMGGILELPVGMPKPARDAVEEGFRKTYEGQEAAFKTVILRENAKFHSAQVSPRDAQMAEGSEQKAREVARYFGIPPSMLGIADAGSYNSKAEDASGYLTHCLRKWLQKIQGQCWLRLLTPTDKRRIEFRHDTDELLRMDFATRAQAYQLAIVNRWMNPNEVRAREGLPPYAGGELFANPNTTSSPPHEPTAAEPEVLPSVSTPQRTQPTCDDLRALYSLTAAARHKAKKPNAFIEWLDSGFAAQRQEWHSKRKKESLPVFFVTLAAELQRVVSETTNDNLAQTVDAVCSTFEGKISNATNSEQPTTDD